MKHLLYEITTITNNTITTTTKTTTANTILLMQIPLLTI